MANESEGHLEGPGRFAQLRHAQVAGDTAPPQALLPEPPMIALAEPAWRSSGASFYGPGFYGQGLACPGVLTEALLGVAHRTLPCGTLVTFRNPSNGVVITVPVVDRGPFIAGRDWDLTGGACLVLDFCHTGSIQWHLGST